MKYHMLFCQKLGKMSQNLSSAAVVIGALRVNPDLSSFENSVGSDQLAFGEYQASSGSKLFDTLII